MTSAHQHAPTPLVLLTYRDPMDSFEVQTTTDVRRRTEAWSSSSVTDVSSTSWENLHDAIARLTENVRASESWLDATDQILLRIDQHATAVASKELYSDRISRFLQYDKRISDSFFELAVHIMSSTHEVEPTHGGDDESVVGNAQYIQKLRYETALIDTFSSAGFQKSDPYVDQQGGLIVDYFRGPDRVTLVFGFEGVHVLTYVKGQFAERLFSPLDTSQLDVRNFLDNLLLAT